MSLRTHRTILVYFEGEDGHRGNVLATGFVGKVRRLLNLLHRMERVYGDLSSRQTEFEIVQARKFNPTMMEFRPVPKVTGYDPIVAFDWTVDQIEAVASGRSVDPRVDVQSLRDLADVATPLRDGSYSRFWMESGPTVVAFDRALANKAEVLVERKSDQTATVRWHRGISRGTVIGDLRAVTDEEGEREFVVQPPVGPTRIVCRFSEEKRAVMHDYLFQKVKVHGLLHYTPESPHPTMIEMLEIEKLDPGRVFLLDVRGIFEGLGRPSPSGFDVLDAV